jgi:hypothetical protein
VAGIEGLVHRAEYERFLDFLEVLIEQNFNFSLTFLSRLLVFLAFNRLRYIGSDSVIYGIFSFRLYICVSWYLKSLKILLGTVASGDLHRHDGQLFKDFILGLAALCW